LADVNNFWQATSRRNFDVNHRSFAHLTLILLLDYLVKYRSRILVTVMSSLGASSIHVLEPWVEINGSY